jgi:hypothetical protein
MDVLEVALWGLLGGFAVEGLDFVRAQRRAAGWPPEMRTSAWYVATAVRLTVGAVLAMALGESGQIAGPIGALGVGAAAPVLVEKFLRAVPSSIDVSGQQLTGADAGPPASAAQPSGDV